jgi:hypothetical protein
LIWATEEPNRVGTISRMIRRTSGELQPQRGTASRSRRRSVGNWNASWRMPASRIAQPMAMIGVCSRGASQSAPPIMHRLRITGVSAGKPNLWKLLSAPPHRAVNETKSRKGNVRRSRLTVSSNLSGDSTAPGENSAVTWGAKRTPRATTTRSTPPSVPAVRDMSCFRSSCGRVSLTSVNTGTKAVEKEPSANRRRMKFGMRNATQNASVAALAPNEALIAMSRTRPRTRETMVMPLKDSTPRRRLGVFIRVRVTANP